MFVLRFLWIVLILCAYIGQHCRISPLCRNKSKASVKSGEGKRREERQSWVLLWVYCSVFKPTEARRTLKSPTSASERISVLELPRPRGGGDGEGNQICFKRRGKLEKKRNVHTKVDRGFTCNRPLLRRQRQTQVLKNRLATGWKYVATRKCSGKKGRLTHLSHMGMSFFVRVSNGM